jgi:hypothetical protein
MCVEATIVCAKDLNVLGLHRHRPALGVDMLYQARNKYPSLRDADALPFTEDGVSQAVADATAMKTVKSRSCPGRSSFRPEAS